MAEMLKIDHICKTFNAGTINEKVALNGVDLTLEDGDFVTVIGGNGAGKSTTLNAVAGVWPVAHSCNHSSFQEIWLFFMIDHHYCSGKNK